MELICAEMFALVFLNPASAYPDITIRVKTYHTRALRLLDDSPKQRCPEILFDRRVGRERSTETRGHLFVTSIIAE